MTSPAVTVSDDQSVPHRPGGQPRRDRLPGDPDAARHGYPLGRRLQRCRRRRPPRARSGRCRADRARSRGRRATSTSRRSSGPARTPAPRRCTPGTDSSARTSEFARALEAAGIAFIGPGVEALDVMGDKIRSKNHVAGYGVPVVPGIAEPGLTDEELIAAAAAVGFPLLIKPSAGGGGKGMHVGGAPGGPAATLATARRVAAGAFGDDTLFLERLVDGPAAHRGAGAGRHPRQRHPPGGARVLPAAPAPEGDRGGAVAAAGIPDRRRRRPRAASARPRARPPAASTTPAPARWSSSSRTTPRTSSSSWR